MTTSIAPPNLPPPPSVDPAAVAAGAGPRPGRAGLGRFVRDLRTTTPGRLRVESVVVVVLALAAGLATTLVVGDRLANTARIAEEAAPVVVNARQVQTNLARANAAAANSFLAGGAEDAGQRQDYEQAMAEAATELESAARLVGDDAEAHEALAALTADLPRYAGLIETARTNNRQGYPVGAAYLTAASRLLEDEIYPATDVVANRAAANYREAYDQQRNLGLVYGAVALGLVAVLAAYLFFLASQLRRRFKRTVNLPVAIALAVTTALGGWLAYGLANHSAHLESARTDGYQGTRLYLDARGIGFGARADEARFLIARGAGAEFETSFQNRVTQIDATWAAIDGRAGSSAQPDVAVGNAAAAQEAWAGYQVLHDEVVGAEVALDRDLAVSLALEDADQSFTRFDDATRAALDANRAQFATEMDRAEGALGGLRFGPLVAMVVVAAAALYGLQLRINEYR